MSGPLHTLKHEHRVIERAMRAIDGLCLRLELGERIPQSALAQLVDFIDAFVDRHHHQKEETYLFPLLEKHGFLREHGPLAAITHEHEIERELTNAMHAALASYSDANSEAKGRFMEASRRYSGHMIAHIRAEDSLLFRLADEILDDADVARLKEGFDRADLELGPRTREEFDQVATQLEDAWVI